MNSKRVYYIMLGVIALLLLGLFGGAYGVNVLLQSKAKKLVDLKLQSQVLASQQIGLNNAKKQVKTYTDLNKIAKTVVPQDKDQAEAVREIVSLASQSGIGQLSSVTFPASTLGAPSIAAPAGAAGTTGTSTTPTTPTVNKNNLTQLVPVVGINGVYQLQITITQASDNRVPYNQFLDFLSRLEQNRRTAQVISISLQPDPKTPDMVAFTLVVNEFIKP
jgi:hypothetical protein